MILIDEALLDRFRTAGRCEFCGRWCDRPDPAHIFSRGAGRVDIPGNLVALCRECHAKNHAGRQPTPSRLLTIAAKREGLAESDIDAEVYRIRRLPSHAGQGASTRDGDAAVEDQRGDVRGSTAQVGPRNLDSLAPPEDDGRHVVF